MTKRFSSGDKKAGFLNSLSTKDIESSSIGQGCSFSFAYYSPTSGGQSWLDWNTHGGSISLDSIMDKLVGFCSGSLEYWERQRVGAGSLTVLSYYGCFPKNTEFKCPSSIPHDVRWGRFRLANKVRLAGFSIPKGHHGSMDSKGFILSSNVFYIVYLDMNHEFYCMEGA